MSQDDSHQQIQPLLVNTTRIRTLLSRLPHLSLPEFLRVFAHHDLKTFELFPRLPVGLRHKIWGLVASEPRDVNLDIEGTRAHRLDGDASLSYWSRTVLSRQIDKAPPIFRSTRRRATRASGTFSWFPKSTWLTRTLLFFDS